MKKLAATTLAGVALALALVGCSPIDSGTITNKTFEPEHSVHTTQCTLVGKITVCTPVTRHYDDAWKFDLRKGDETGWVYVTESEYESYDIGDEYR